MKIESPTGHSWITLATFDQREDADRLHAALKEQGFDPQIEDERNAQRLWYRAPQKAGVHVQVHEDSLVMAKQFVVSNPGLMLAAVRCPACRSSRVQYPAMTRKNILPTLVAQMLVFAHLMEREYYCEDCHFTWVKTPRTLQPTSKTT